MNLKVVKPAVAAIIAVTVLAAPAIACDKAVSNERISKVVAKGDAQRPTRVSEGFAIEVTEKFWASAEAKQKDELAADVACSVGSDTVSFTKDRSVLQTYRNGKPQ